MKNIQEAVNFTMDIKNSKKQSLDELCKDPLIIEFMKQNDLSRNDMDHYWLELLNFKEDYPICKMCTGLRQCPKSLVGFKRKLVKNEQGVQIVMEACKYQKEHAALNKILDHITTNLPKNLFVDKFKEVGTSNAQLFVHLLQFATNLENNGIYLYGPTQSGKTKMMAYFAYYLASSGKEVAMMNVPNLMGRLKSSFNDDEINANEILYRLKTAEILILDDIGGENFSTWSRDEVISTIIEERSLSELPTFYTSVYSYSDLQKYYTTTQKGDAIKVTKLIEKIKANTIAIQSN